LGFFNHSRCGKRILDEEPVKLGKSREGDDGMRTKRDGAVVFVRLDELVGELENDYDVLLETYYEGFCLTQPGASSKSCRKRSNTVCHV